MENDYKIIKKPLTSKSREPDSIWIPNLFHQIE